MFFPLHGARRLRATVKRLNGEWVSVEREDGTSARLSLDRLLASDGEGGGLHYRFHGWKHRPRGYRTEFEVIAVSEEQKGCVLVLPEWDAETEIEVPLGVVPEELQVKGAVGTCMADLSSPSAAALGIHGCSQARVRDVSRGPRAPYPEVLVKGQRFRRRSDQARFRLLDGGGDDSASVSAWNGKRVVRLGGDMLLEIESSGNGRYYEYEGGGVHAMRRRLASRDAGGRAR